MTNEMGPKLSPQQIIKYQDRLRPHGDPEIRICRFLYHGRALNIQTGELASKGSNVIYHRHYWNWNTETALEIARDLGIAVKVVWSE